MNNAPTLAREVDFVRSYPIDTASASPERSKAWRGVGPLLRGRRPWLVAALVLTAAMLLALWAWLGTTAMLPLLYLLPCAAMMAMCMKGHGSSSATAARSSSGAPPNTGAPT